MPSKPDGEDILAHMRELAGNLRLDGARRWWPDWVYRSDHVENTATILNSGRLLSRAAAEQQGVIVRDAASPSHIGGLTGDLRRFVRLYLRPKTPTQYANEGIRPISKIEYSAHMPIPVYLIFSVKLLAEEGVEFTKGRLMPGAERGSSIEFLQSMEFKDIYHVGSVGQFGGPDRLSHVINARNSEAIVLDELPLTHLHRIVCRSQPERETLLNLLDEDVRERWEDRVILERSQRQLFCKRGTFVAEVELESDKSVFKFYTNTDFGFKGPFRLRIDWDADNWRGLFYEKEDFAVGHEPLRLRFPEPREQYQVRVALDGNLAYLGQFEEQDDWEHLF